MRLKTADKQGARRSSQPGPSKKRVLGTSAKPTGVLSSRVSRATSVPLAPLPPFRSRDQARHQQPLIQTGELQVSRAATPQEYENRNPYETQTHRCPVTKPTTITEKDELFDMTAFLDSYASPSPVSYVYSPFPVSYAFSGTTSREAQTGTESESSKDIQGLNGLGVFMGAKRAGIEDFLPASMSSQAGWHAEIEPFFTASLPYSIPPYKGVDPLDDNVLGTKSQAQLKLGAQLTGSQITGKRRMRMST